jgi:hypothetical protein
MIDYSEILLNIQKLHRDCHEALLKRNWKQARQLASAISLEAEDLEEICRNKEGEGK